MTAEQAERIRRAAEKASASRVAANMTAITNPFYQKRWADYVEASTEFEAALRAATEEK